MIRNILITLGALPILTLALAAFTGCPEPGPGPINPCAMDINGDGAIGVDDIGLFFEGLDNAEYPESWDFDGNGVVDDLDGAVMLDNLGGICI